MDAILTAVNFKPKRIMPPFGWIGHIPFAGTLVRQLKPGLIVELGTHTGNSYFTFCQAVKENLLATRCYAVDTWQGEAHAGHYDETVFQDVDSYNKENYSDFSYLLRTTFDEASKQFSNNSIDILHIDGLHTYEAVKNDYEKWCPLVREGGVILFHDICCRHADFGVWKLWEEIQLGNKHTLSFYHSYGLGVLVKSELSINNELIARLTNGDKPAVWQYTYAALGNAILNQAESKLAISHRDSAIESLNRELTQRDSTIESLNGKLTQHDSAIESLTGKLTQRDSAIESLNGKLTQRDSTIASLNILHAELSRLTTEALNSARSHKIELGAAGQNGQPLSEDTPLLVLQSIIAATYLELGNLHGQLDQARAIQLQSHTDLTRQQDLLAEFQKEKLRLEALIHHHATQHRLAEEKLILVHKTVRSIRRSWFFRLYCAVRALASSPHSPGPRRFYFSIDLAPKSRRAENPFTMAGWFLDDAHRPARRLIARIGKHVIDLKRCSRPDLLKTFPTVDDRAGLVGFHHQIKTRPGWKLVSVEAETEAGETMVIWRRLLLVGALHKHHLPVDYSTWLKTLNQVCPPSQALGGGPLISILMPVYNPPERWLRRAIESVRAQTYTRWQLCIGNDASTLPHVRTVLDSFTTLDSRILVVHRPQNGHISAASNSALELCSGDFTALLDHDDELAPHALAEIVNALAKYPDASIMYSDEDKINAQGERFDPYFKPAWNPDLLLGQNTFCHLTAYRTSLLRDVGGFRVGFEGAQDWDLALRASEKVAPATILHIPRILYHWRAIAGSTALNLDQKPYHLSAAGRVLQETVARRRWAASVLQTEHGLWRVKFSLPSSPPLVSLIIPTRNRVDILRPCIESIVARTTYPNYEIIIVDNASDDAATLAYLAELSTRDPRISVLRDEGPFNYSALNNRAAEKAQGELLALVNNDIEPINPDWLEEMCAQALRPEIGAVGALLYYPDNKVQHGGVVLGLAGPKQTEGIAGHAFKFYPRGHEGSMNRLRLVQNYTAVTAACLVVRTSVFMQVKGLNESDLAVSFNDVDFCLRLHSAGYRNLWTPFAELYHHESASRGKPDDPSKMLRAQQEANYMRRRWASLLDHDPAYNPNLTLVDEDFSLAKSPQTLVQTARSST